MKQSSSPRWILLIVLWVLFSVFTVVQAQTVYTTKTGDKYHKESCQYLKYSKIETTKSVAVSRGYTACSVCKPGGSTTSSSGAGVEKWNQGAVSLPVQSTATQCTGITQAGARCRNMTKSSSGRCHHHD